MVQVICEKTGIEFEAATKRTKNHPTIMSILNRAAKDEWYGYAIRAIGDGRELGYATIEEYVEALEAAESQSDEAYRQHMAKKRAEKAARRERGAFDYWLSQHGYQWHNIGFRDEEEADAFNPNLPVGDEWTLVDAGGNTVSVAEVKAAFEK